MEEILRSLPFVLKKRQQVQRTRSATDRQIASLFVGRIRVVSGAVTDSEHRLIDRGC